MEQLCIGQIVAACAGTLLCGDPNHMITDLTTDSRQAKPGALFIALKGERFDGNQFAASFLQTGDGAIVSRPIKPHSGKHIILVDDTHRALREIASFYRSQFSIPLIGITGSVGKTSTKDMLACVLSQAFQTLKTQGNFNNEIGLPLTMFRLERCHQVAVVEMGMSDFGEIGRLTAIARPSVAVITNIGTAHIGTLGSQRNILKAKLEILQGLPSDGTVVLNGDDPFLWDLKGTFPYKTVYFGIQNTLADITASQLTTDINGSTFHAAIDGKDYLFSDPVIGGHHIYNALAAILVGRILGMDPKALQLGVSQFKTEGLRQNIITIGGVTLIEDCYNASVPSMKASLDVLSQFRNRGRMIAVLGDILELGDFSEQMHREVGTAVAEKAIDLLVTVGPGAAFIAKQAAECGMEHILAFDSNQQALDALTTNIRQGDTILLKGSRGMKLEQISAGLKDYLEG